MNFYVVDLFTIREMPARGRLRLPKWAAELCSSTKTLKSFATRIASSLSIKFSWLIAKQQKNFLQLKCFSRSTGTRWHRARFDIDFGFAFRRTLEFSIVSDHRGGERSHEQWHRNELWCTGWVKSERACNHNWRNEVFLGSQGCYTSMLQAIRGTLNTWFIVITVENLKKLLGSLELGEGWIGKVWSLFELTSEMIQICIE